MFESKKKKQQFFGGQDVMKIRMALLVVLSIVTLIFLGGCTRKNFSVLSQMSDEQANFFEKEIVAPFSRAQRISVTVVNVEDGTQVRNLLVQRGEGAAGLVKVPFEENELFVNGGYLQSFDTFADPLRLEQIKETLLLCTLGVVQKKQYYVPREFKTRIMVYRKSKVHQAIRVWRGFRSQINNDLRLVNGYGLPSNYLLEDDPELWDFYDIYVLGWIWSRQEHNGTIGPRIAHPFSPVRGGGLRQIDHAYQFNADSASITAITGDQIIDMFQWEALYAHGGIYNPSMWEKKWTRQDLWQAFADEKVFLSLLTQKDVFHIYGTGADNMDGYLAQKGDLAFATVPMASSLELDRFGIPVRTGSKSIVTGGWWWAVPQNAPYRDLSLKLVEHLSGSVSQIEESSRFGVIPAGKEILSHLPIIAGDHWISQLYTTSFMQMKENGYNFLSAAHGSQELSQRYTRIWERLVSHSGWMESGVPERRLVEREIQKASSQ